MDSGQLFDAVIVGGGLAGTTVAAELALLAPPGFRALLIDAAEPGPGSAYAPPTDRLYMNGTARAMSAVSGDKQHLVKWLRTEPESALISRRTFGRYLRERLREALDLRPEFETLRAEVVDVVADGEYFTVVDAHGGERAARHVVLALGNFPPDYAFLPQALHRHAGFVADPWRFDPGAAHLRGDMLIVGNGLTAMDTAALLDERGFEGTLHLVSRRGLSPCVENPFARALDPSQLALQTQTPYALLRSLRAAARAHSARGGDWRDVVEAIRPVSGDIWTSWNVRERKRFLRHLEVFWAIHRYRVPPKTAVACERMRREGRLVSHRGRIREATETPDRRIRVELQGPRGMSSFVVSCAINCTGPNGDYERVRHPLVQNLIRRGTIRSDELHLGLEATPDLHVVDAAGNKVDRVFTLGPPLRGLFYETTAVPETREQAAAIARTVVRESSHAALEAAS
ncbi:MAG TPA: FAD/NAD(P)-binding protein [Candidatus Baltobacteraceae bacterium]|jgi:uncharacterized NAD(P)/FAD-binding protein YdhS|nr:FAD/NAD(P)-binding protein [Candidatus Baltobacteraceae bacterium]